MLRNTHIRKIVLVINLILIVISGALAQNENDPDGAIISVDKFVYEYGTIQKGSPGNCTFIFTNTGKEPLILANVQTSCGCTTPSWTVDPVLPNKKGKIDVHYDTNRMGAFVKQLSIISNALNSPTVINIRGVVVDTPAATTPDNNITPKSK